ncbi:hypothetical protein VK92_05410 [Burkholderia sp. LK4]|nr:hypothetical protein VL00_05225 [Burkholderia cepacia]KMN62014.1 hypothetical protein VK92_05410 [Burkholderia sp. LK4]
MARSVPQYRRRRAASRTLASTSSSDIWPPNADEAGSGRPSSIACANCTPASSASRAPRVAADRFKG